MKEEKTRQIKIWQIACNDSERYLKPTQAAIEAMKTSLVKDKQIHPIAVYPVAINKYRLISGATRFRAACSLKWETIRATIWVGSALDYLIHELAENLDRHELSADVRKRMKARKKELEKERLKAIKTAKGGRGKKGGIAEEARQMAMPRTTARRLKDDKPGHIQESGQVSDDSKPNQKKKDPTKRHPDAIASAHMPLEELAALDAWAVSHSMNRSNAMRLIIRERIEADAAIDIPNILKFPSAS